MTPFKTFTFLWKKKLRFDNQNAYRKLIQYAIMKKYKLSFGKSGIQALNSLNFRLDIHYKKEMKTEY